ncbi:BRCA1-associated RING domain protein 1 isoform X2 [Dunckerocampus dactyliophorus]|uniref:BRCA1-associated RING domain protein 1 isoform X2 n=1 Tax=Dunckerocampus dactyliophorus TaxID=161453 RepID=UPI00240670E0|nr:BRCA1-associated RING domain protein 1 isoform X2 [Dunckerocampus dactyliophorus]
MDTCVEAHQDAWKNTKEAVANFRRLLLCSKWSCAGPQAGDGCVVCQSPAWVKDIQINRQLSSIIQLFSGLESMLNPSVQPESSEAVVQPQNEGTVLKHKKNFKIWFSPRSRKVRCMVEKSAEDIIPANKSLEETAAVHPGNKIAEVNDLTVFNFTSSSQDSGSLSPKFNTNKKKRKRSNKKSIACRKATMERATRKQTRQIVKKNKLDAINKQWGITEDEDAFVESEPTGAQVEGRSNKRVSFLSPDSGSGVIQQGLSEATITVPKNQTQFCSNKMDTLPASDSILTDNPQKQASKSSPKQSSKRPRLEGEIVTLETTPKRRIASPGGCRKSLGRSSPTDLKSPSPSRRCKKTSREDKGESPPLPSIVGRKSPSSHASVRSPTVTKKNRKGETPLHLAAIKGDVEAVRELLDQGADPNLKDNAGWTPLHEACNLGHLAVVEVLVSRGALVNTPGYENDSPLHDAVRNGHIAVVKLLLHFGASQNVLNLHGKRPADCAVSREMLTIFHEASEDANTSMTSLASLSVGSCVKQDEIVFLSTKLSQTDRCHLSRLSRLLDGSVTDTFTSSVSHVVVPEGPIPTTHSTLLGLLAGCWIVKYSWVEACLQAGKRMPENEHEAGEGPQRSRINRCSLLPPLFDGCYFFLLGAFKSPRKDELAKLLREGGGQLLSRQPKPDSDVTQTLSAAAYHALPGSDQAFCTQYIIFDPQSHYKPSVVRRGKVWSAPSTWIIDCIAAFQLLPVPDLQSG